MNNTKLYWVTLLAFASLLSSNYAVAQTDPPVRVFAWGMHFGGQIVYKYRVQNLGNYPIDRIAIGFYPPTATADGAAELSIAPFYPEGKTMWLPPRVSQSPAGWGVNLSFPDESATFALDWIEASHYRRMRPKANHPDIPVAQNPPNIMLPGATWDQFSVTLPEPDKAYINGHANFSYGNNDVTVQMEKGDTTPPTLTVNLSPTTPPETDKLTPITATITVKDDYDPQPEIKLDSIAVNEVYAPNDIQDASLGTDDRQFLLKAEQEGKNPLGRIYTVQYSATDGSGNTSIATATVTVQRPKEDKEHKKEEAHKGTSRQERQSDKDKSFWKFW
jgi:hypothetical protein